MVEEVVGRVEAVDVVEDVDRGEEERGGGGGGLLGGGVADRSSSQGGGAGGAEVCVGSDWH